MARRLEVGIRDVPGIELAAPVEINALFPRLDGSLLKRLQSQSLFYLWDENARIARWMTAFDTPESDVDAFIRIIKEAAPETRESA